MPVSYAVDLSALDQRYIELQKEVHPDRFAGRPDAEQRQALLMAGYVNAAQVTLKDPLKRAIYMLQLNNLELEEHPVLPPEFLMEQIELREELEALEAHPDSLEEVDKFKRRVREVMASLEGKLEVAFKGDIHQAETIVYELQFMGKLFTSADRLEEKLLDGPPDF